MTAPRTSFITKYADVDGEACCEPGLAPLRPRIHRHEGRHVHPEEGQLRHICTTRADHNTCCEVSMTTKVVEMESPLYNCGKINELLHVLRRAQ